MKAIKMGINKKQSFIDYLNLLNQGIEKNKKQLQHTEQYIRIEEKFISIAINILQQVNNSIDAPLIQEYLNKVKIKQNKKYHQIDAVFYNNLNCPDTVEQYLKKNIAIEYLSDTVLGTTEQQYMYHEQSINYTLNHIKNNYLPSHYCHVVTHMFIYYLVSQKPQEILLNILKNTYEDKDKEIFYYLVNYLTCSQNSIDENLVFEIFTHCPVDTYKIKTTKNTQQSINSILDKVLIHKSITPISDKNPIIHKI